MTEGRTIYIKNQNNDFLVCSFCEELVAEGGIFFNHVKGRFLKHR